jgi:hypothetical protein
MHTDRRDGVPSVDPLTIFGMLQRMAMRAEATGGQPSPKVAKFLKVALEE